MSIFFTASPVNHYEQLSLSEITNNTRLIPEILNHTSQLTELWAQLRIMTDKLDKIQDELENCSLGARYGHLTAATPSTAAPSEWQLHLGFDNLVARDSLSSIWRKNPGNEVRALRKR